MQGVSLSPKKSITKKHPKSPSKINDFERVIFLLSKPRKERTVQNNKIIGEYLSNKFTYFKKLKDQSDYEKLGKLVSVLNYEIFEKDSKIINCGDEGDKFYVLLEGLVGIYKPFPKEVEMSFRNYVEYLCHARDEESNYAKFKRIILQNPEVDHFSLKRINFDYTQIKQSHKKKVFILEEDKKLAEFGGGFAFGEMALIKREPRNATIIALDHCKLVSIDKIDYNKIIREIEEKRLGHVIREFKNNFPLFEYWGGYQCLRLFNFLEKESLTFGDYLYKQNDQSDAIYFIRSGTFEMTTIVSFAWYEEFISYIYDTSFSLVNRMDKKDLFSETEIKNFMSLAENVIQSPCFIKHPKIKNIVTSIKKEMDIVDVKLEQDDLNNPQHFFKANIKKVTAPECVGYEDALELKPRFCSIKCISKTAEIQKVNLFEFIKLIPHDQKNQFVFQQNVFEKKMYLIQQLKNNTVMKLNLIDDKMKKKYETAIKIEFPELYEKKKFSNDKKLTKTNNNLSTINNSVSTKKYEKEVTIEKTNTLAPLSLKKCSSTGDFSNPNQRKRNQNVFLDYDILISDGEKPKNSNSLRNPNIKGKLLKQKSIRFSKIGEYVKRNRLSSYQQTKEYTTLNFKKFKDLASEICKMEKMFVRHKRKTSEFEEQPTKLFDIQSSKSTVFSSSNQSNILTKSLISPNPLNSIDSNNGGKQSPKTNKVAKLPALSKHSIPIDIKMKYFKKSFLKNFDKLSKIK